MNGNLKEKVVILTGAAHGLGKALAMEFYNQGCHLALLDIDLTGLTLLKEKLSERNGQRITIHQTDVPMNKVL